MHMKISMTGAAGRVGSVLRKGLRRSDRSFRLLDVNALGEADTGEELLHLDLNDLEKLTNALRGSDVLIHLAAIPDERPWEELFPLNYQLAFNAFEAARRAGIRRLIYASSIQAVGFHPMGNGLDGCARLRPSGLYGLSKGFGEALGSLYADRHGISVYALRIASFEDKPSDQRMLKTWLSHRDAIHLFDRCLDVPAPHFTVVYGVSANDRGKVSNSHADWLGYRPVDNAERYRDEVEATGRKLGRIAALTHGGGACDVDFTDEAMQFLDF